MFLTLTLLTKIIPHVHFKSVITNHVAKHVSNPVFISLDFIPKSQSYHSVIPRFE